MGGRPSKYTPERVKRIIDALSAGNTRKAAAQYAGINEDTIANWCRQYSDFSARAREAEAQAEIQAVAIIRRGIQNGDTADAKWWLERRRPDDYGRREKVDLELFVRQRARELGIDEDEAMQIARPHLKLA